MWVLVLILVVLVLLLGLGYPSPPLCSHRFAGADSKEAPKREWGTADLSGLKKRIGRLDQAGQ